MEKYALEREGQLDFYRRFLPRIDPAIAIDDILADNNDGVLNGNLLEFKLHVIDLNAALFQSIKYLSALRIKCGLDWMIILKRSSCMDLILRMMATFLKVFAFPSKECIICSAQNIMINPYFRTQFTMVY